MQYSTILMYSLFFQNGLLDDSYSIVHSTGLFMQAFSSLCKIFQTCPVFHQCKDSLLMVYMYRCKQITLTYRIIRLIKKCLRKLILHSYILEGLREKILKNNKLSGWFIRKFKQAWSEPKVQIHGYYFHKCNRMLYIQIITCRTYMGPLWSNGHEVFLNRKFVMFSLSKLSLIFSTYASNHNSSSEVSGHKN